MCATFSISLVPNAPPENVQALTRSPTAILVTWEQVPEIDHNGIITLYEVEFNQNTFNEISTSNLTTTNASQLMVELEGLEEDILQLVQLVFIVMTAAIQDDPANKMFFESNVSGRVQVPHIVV